jgi:endonuclease YncB( thermonuclease family)
VRRSGGKVRHFWRGARRQPQWTVAGPRRRRGDRLPRVLKRALFGLVALLMAIPLGDVANGYLKPHDGCRVVGIVDGDTVVMRCPASGLKTARLLGFDTPELRAACTSEALRAQAATFHLRWLLWTAGHISARIDGLDRYGRALTVLMVDGQGVARLMIEAGHARRYDGGRRAGWCG